MITCFGRLRINGMSPDNKVSLANYIFDEERVMFDYSRLSDEKKAIFMQWFLEPHQQERETIFTNNITLNEYRGYTAEVLINWWKQIKNWFFRTYCDYWRIFDFGLSLHYQLTGIEMSHGKQGTSIGFHQYFVPPTGNKYKDPKSPYSEPMGNTKRVYITNHLVDQLVALNINTINFESLCKNPHPQSIEIIDQQARFVDMHTYRVTQKFQKQPYWYAKIWNWFTAIFKEKDKENYAKDSQKVDNSLKLIYETNSVQIYERVHSKEIIVKEHRPNIDNIVFCGGGVKIYAHVGVWMALNEAKIHPAKFAGSSAGAVMELLCYLNYSADEMIQLFNSIKQEHLVYFKIDTNGLADSHSLKTFLDYVIACKLKQLVEKYKIPYPQGKITFATLDNISKQYPGCGLKKGLTVTGTIKRSGKTRYFSAVRSPTMEVSEAVRISSSIPVLFRHTVIDGEEYNDGGISSNFPTEAFSDDHSTFLESESGNNLKVLAIQFDNGTERTAVDKIKDRVYRENFFVNWIYRLLTGVYDPASGWEQDRLKLRQYASQSIVIDVGDVSATSFSIDEVTRNKLIKMGYEAAKSYLEVRYSTKENRQNINNELMYSSFSSLGDLLAYCCYRGDKQWFEIVNNLLLESNLPNRTALLKQSLKLRAIYFNVPNTQDADETKENRLTFFGNNIAEQSAPKTSSESTNILIAIYPIFLKLTHEFVKNSNDKRLLELAHHSLNIQSPLDCLDHFAKIEHQSHVVLSILINLLKELRTNPSEKIYASLKLVHEVLSKNSNLVRMEFFCEWNLSLQQSMRVLNLLHQDKWVEAITLCKSLSKMKEPMQTFIGGTYHDDLSDGSLERDRLSPCA